MVAKADTLISANSNELIAVRVADCVPILIANTDGSHVAAVHAGWRGVVADAVSIAVARLAERSGQSPSAFVAAIGPCISAEHFEVGTEVADAFNDADLALLTLLCRFAGEVLYAILQQEDNPVSRAGEGAAAS